MNRQATLLGMQAGQTSGALAAEQQAIANDSADLKENIELYLEGQDEF